MPHTPEDLEPDNWHRYFAMENNNRAWQLAIEDRKIVLQTFAQVPAP